MKASFWCCDMTFRSKFSLLSTNCKFYLLERNIDKMDSVILLQRNRYAKGLGSVTNRLQDSIQLSVGLTNQASAMSVSSMSESWCAAMSCISFGSRNRYCLMPLASFATAADTSLVFLKFCFLKSGSNDC